MSVKYWEIIADNLSKAGWSWGCVSTVDSNGRTSWIADALIPSLGRFEFLSLLLETPCLIPSPPEMGSSR